MANAKTSPAATVASAAAAAAAASADKIAELFPASGAPTSNQGASTSNQGAQRNQSSRSRSGVNDPNFVAATIFLNPGITVPVKNRVTGEIVPTFIATPKGLGLDNMEFAEEKGTPEWVELMKARNKALRYLQSLGAKLPSGGVLQYSDTLQIRRQADPAAQIPEDESDLLSSMEGMFSAADCRLLNVK